MKLKQFMNEKIFKGIDDKYSKTKIKKVMFDVLNKYKMPMNKIIKDKDLKNYYIKMRKASNETAELYKFPYTYKILYNRIAKEMPNDMKHRLETRSDLKLLLKEFLKEVIDFNKLEGIRFNFEFIRNSYRNNEMNKVLEEWKDLQKAKKIKERYKNIEKLYPPEIKEFMKKNNML